MPLPLPDLDDRRWADLVDEARSMLHRLAPAWTDYNLSDPGITLLDLFAWLTEVEIFGVDRIPKEHRAQFVSLVGIKLRRIAPARTPLRFSAGAAPLDLPAGVVFQASTPSADPVLHSLAYPITVLGCALSAVQVWNGTDYLDCSANLRPGRALRALGSDPAVGAALLLGLDPTPALDAAAQLSLWITIDDSMLSPVEHFAAPRHHSARIAWEYHDGTDWQAFAGDIIDETRSLTRTGRVVLPVGEVGAANGLIGAVPRACRWLRARLAAGRHDVAPIIQELLVDATAVVQSVPAYAAWPCANPTYQPGFLVSGTEQAFRLSTDATGRIIEMAPPQPTDTDLPYAQILAAQPGTITLSLVPAGFADGAPSFETVVDGAPFSDSHAAVWTTDQSGSTAWRIVETLRRSSATDRHVEFDAGTGVLRFGDGQHGRVPVAGSLAVVRTHTTLGTTGTPVPGATWRLDAGNPVTTALLAGQVDVTVQAAAPLPARAGDDLETGEGRAADQVWAHERLIELAPEVSEPSLDQVGRAAALSRSRPDRAATELDFERLALDVPGTGVVRARAWAGLDPSLPGFSAPGSVTVVVVPGLPASRPQPTQALLTEVRRYLCPRRTLGTRLIVTGPDYVEVTVRATIDPERGVDTLRVQSDAVERLAEFLHPLTGGPRRTGWPFGRDVYQADVLRELDLVDGVDHVVQIELIAGGQVVDCGNVCVAPTSLVVSGPHEVIVR
jgi:predicted phage baseplate assembly protein